MAEIAAASTRNQMLLVVLRCAGGIAILVAALRAVINRLDAQIGVGVAKVGVNARAPFPIDRHT
jgi:hypothetical protein